MLKYVLVHRIPFGYRVALCKIRFTAFTRTTYVFITNETLLFSMVMTPSFRIGVGKLRPSKFKSAAREHVFYLHGLRPAKKKKLRPPACTCSSEHLSTSTLLEGFKAEML